PRVPRREDDVYMLYTGGTTGMPKGVMYAMGGVVHTFIRIGYPILGLTPSDDAAGIPEQVRQLHARGEPAISIPACPLMHGTGVWLGAFVPHLAGGTVITLQSRSF